MGITEVYSSQGRGGGLVGVGHIPGTGAATLPAPTRGGPCEPVQPLVS